MAHSHTPAAQLSRVHTSCIVTASTTNTIHISRRKTIDEQDVSLRRRWDGQSGGGVRYVGRKKNWNQFESGKSVSLMKNHSWVVVVVVVVFASVAEYGEIWRQRHWQTAETLLQIVQYNFSFWIVKRERDWQHISFICHTELDTDVNYVFPFFYITKIYLHFLVHIRSWRARVSAAFESLAAITTKTPADCGGMQSSKPIRSMWKWPEKEWRANVFVLYGPALAVTIPIFVEFNILPRLPTRVQLLSFSIGRPSARSRSLIEIAQSEQKKIVFDWITSYEMTAAAVFQSIEKSYRSRKLIIYGLREWAIW